MMTCIGSSATKSHRHHSGSRRKRVRASSTRYGGCPESITPVVEMQKYRGLSIPSSGLGRPRNDGELISHSLPSRPGLLLRQHTIDHLAGEPEIVRRIAHAGKLGAVCVARNLGVLREQIKQRLAGGGRHAANVVDEIVRAL